MISFDSEKFKQALKQRHGFLLQFFARFKSGIQSREARKIRLALVERISIAPRQSLALVEAEGRRILVATSADGVSAFFALDGAGPDFSVRARTRPQSRARKSQQTATARVSW